MSGSSRDIYVGGSGKAVLGYLKSQSSLVSSVVWSCLKFPSTRGLKRKHLSLFLEFLFAG